MYLLAFPSALESQTTKEKWYVANSILYTPIIAIVTKTVLDDSRFLIPSLLQILTEKHKTIWVSFLAKIDDLPWCEGPTFFIIDAKSSTLGNGGATHIIDAPLCSIHSYLFYRCRRHIYSYQVLIPGTICRHLGPKPIYHVLIKISNPNPAANRKKKKKKHSYTREKKEGPSLRSVSTSTVVPNQHHGCSDRPLPGNNHL